MSSLLFLAKRLDRLNEAMAKIARLSILLMLGLGLWNVIGRYLGVAIGHNLSSNGLIEGQWYLFDLAFLLGLGWTCLLYTSPSPRDRQKSRMPSSA